MGIRVICAVCGHARRVAARGLCGWCYGRCRYRDTHLDHPTRQRKSADTVDAVATLALRGADKAEVLAVLGVTWDAVTLAHRRAGVPVPPRYRYDNGGRKVVGSGRLRVGSVTV